MNHLRAVVSHFDPARPGFVGCIARVGALLAVLLSCSVCALAYPAAHTPTGRYISAVLWLQADQYDRVVAISRALVDELPDRNIAYYKILAAGLRRSGDIDGQMAVYDEAVAAIPDSWTGHSQRCWYGAIFGRPADVMDSCERAVELAPYASGWAHVRRGAAKAMLDDRDGAIADIQEGLARWDRFAPGRDTIQPWRMWLTALEEGGDPFDDRVLEYERGRF